MTDTGGPLFNGDIEDYKGKACVACPWHGYMFDLESGKCEIGIRVSDDTTALTGVHVNICTDCAEPFNFEKLRPE